MRIGVVSAATVLFLGLFAIRSTDQVEMCRLRVRCVDSRTGENVPGLISVRNSDGERIAIAELLDRGQGLKQSLPIHEWSVLPESKEILVPQGKLHLRAFSGIETEIASVNLDLSGHKSFEATLRLKKFYDAHKAGYRNANTHVHLRKITKPESNRYLLEIWLFDGLDLVFVSYLERANADVDYTTNRYSKKEIESLSTKHVHFGHGQEHRHNFGPGDEGYGHVMLLNIPELIYPVSIGPGISKTGTDGIPLQRGIDQAHELGGSVIWCHNDWGLEDTPNWLAGRLHANNIFDGGTHGSFQHSYYRYWSTGLKVPVSTGTDWFIYDFSRVYVPSKDALDVEEWLTKLRDGKSYITNGPLLEFNVNGKGLGEDIQLDGPETLTVSGTSLGRVDFQELQLIQNGNVVHKVKAKKNGGHYEASFEIQLDINQPCWLALRTPPPSSSTNQTDSTSTLLNEYGEELFSHTSGTFLDIKSQRIFDIPVANSLLKEMQTNLEFIKEKGLFADETEKQTVLSVYREGIADLKKRIAKAENR